MNEILDRCRLILGVCPGLCSAEQVIDALSGGDVATVILFPDKTLPNEFAPFCKKLVPLIQERGIAVVISDDHQLVERTDADGIYVEKTKNELPDIIARFSPQKIVGCGGIKDRHGALKAGEYNPDFVLFGKLGADVKPEPHPKNLTLGEWWAELVEVPTVLPCGNEIDSVVAVAKTGADFVLAQTAVFSAVASPGEMVSRANRLLEKHAPSLSELNS